jgi:hypothetical protein
MSVNVGARGALRVNANAGKMRTSLITSLRDAQIIMSSMMSVLIAA